MFKSDKKRKINLRFAPYGWDFKLPKSKFYRGPEFEETWLGWTGGAKKQYRGPYNQHLLECDTYYLGHKDKTDPREDPGGHITKDAPELLVLIFGGIITFLMGLWMFRPKKEKEQNKKVSKDDSNRELIIGIIIIIFMIIVIFGIFFLVKHIRESSRRLIDIYCKFIITVGV